MAPNVPEKPTLDGLEQRWTDVWEREGTYRFDRTKTRDAIFSVDTPPPTVSGSLHVGSAWGYVQADSIVRYHRMKGREVYYPMGWDDNGLATERRVQNHYGVRCEPSLPYDPDFTPPAQAPKDPISVSRPNFIELCAQLTASDEKAFEEVWRRLSLSVDWSLTYTTMDERSRRISQRAFLRNLERGEAYSSEAPTLWDVDFRTAVAQAELEDREVAGAYHRLRFRIHGAASGGAGATAAGSSAEAAYIEIETTRPELLPACVALVAHPDDARYQPYFGHHVVTPLFGARVPVVAHRLAEPDKGSGIAMICTFGDVTDVIWWRELDLPVRVIVGRDGRLLPVNWSEAGWEAEDPAVAQTAYDELAQKTVRQAQRRIVELLGESGDLLGEPRPITHPVKYYERGERPLEIVSSRQWYIRNGSRQAELRDVLIERGRQLEWHPDFMRVRYEDWVQGLNNDWLISRQRFFGVAFPVWYPVRDDGTVDHDHPIRAREEDLPVDPTTDVPHGYDASQRDQPGGFTGEADVMDTWATSSVTPLIASYWEENQDGHGANVSDLFGRVYPMDLRPQGHDIIRTWLFSTVLRAQLQWGALPWRSSAINGMIQDPDRKKMSKSKGEVTTPLGLVEEFGADGFRYWSTAVRPGMDAVFDTGQMKIGRRLAIKILNVSKFVLGRVGDDAGSTDPSAITHPLDVSLVRNLAALVEQATEAFDGYDFARCLERTETFFWSFCDDYVELVKARAYGSAPAGGAGSGPAAADQDSQGAGETPGSERPAGTASAGTASARAALATTLSVLLRLFAPLLPFVTEEAWSWWNEGSIHRAAWPEVEELGPAATRGVGPVLEAVSEVLAQVRKAKSEASRSMRAGVARLVVTDTAERLELVRLGADDLRDAGSVAELELAEGEAAVSVTLAED